MHLYESKFNLRRKRTVPGAHLALGRNVKMVYFYRTQSLAGEISLVARPTIVSNRKEGWYLRTCTHDIRLSREY